MSATDFIASYAAIVATAALALEVRRWVEGKPRLILSISPSMQMFDGMGSIDKDKEYFVSTVVNRGALQSSLEAVTLLSFGSLFSRTLRFKPTWSAVCLRPIGSPTLPHTIATGELWRGAIEYDADLRDRVDSGKLFVGIYVTHRNRPLLKKVRPSSGKLVADQAS